MGRRDAVHVSHLNGQSKRRRIKFVKKSAYFSLGLLRIPRQLQRQLLSPLATRHALAAAGTGPQWKTHFQGFCSDFPAAALRPERYVEKITEYLFYFILSLRRPGTARHSSSTNSQDFPFLPTVGRSPFVDLESTRGIVAGDH